MNEDERDIIEFTDDEGNTLLLELVDTFFYNGEEYGLLEDAAECGGGCCCEGCESGCNKEETPDQEHDHEHSLYIMKIVPGKDDQGEDVEEFVPVEEELMDTLIDIVRTRIEEDDDFDEDDEDEEDEPAEEPEAE